MPPTDRDANLDPVAFIDLGAQYRRLKADIDAAIAGVLEDGRFVLGPAVAELEAALAARAGAAHAVTCASGTDALLIALMAEGIGPGDAVFVPGFTFPATAGVVALVGAAPVFVDVAEESCMMDPADLAVRAARVADEGRLVPRAVIAADLFGQAADYVALAPIAAERGMLLIDDAAQSFGGASGGRPVGALWRRSPPAASTRPSRSAAMGTVARSSPTMRRRPRAGARSASTARATASTTSFGSASTAVLDTLQAAVLLVKLPAFDAEIDARERVAALYDSVLAGAVGLPGRLPERRSTWAQYTIRLDRRDEVQAALAAQGIPTAIHYPVPMHLQPAYRGWGEGPGSLPVSERLSRQVLCLPMHADLDEPTAMRIARAVRDAVGG